ncbi:helix-turn-helix domain-containing protein [Klenkia sp. LSe6-5]|uniref:Helix-turn-helix domain-containing protein n=1 Tax=Klenkia sesuvii TaxID=3103137 RepID=A0ABU8DSI3_9ACTN
MRGRRRGAVANAAGDSYLYLPDGPADLRWDDFEALPVRLPLHEVTRSAAEQTGMPADALRVTSPRPLTDRHARTWLRAAHLLRDQLGDPGPSHLGPLVHRELVNLTAATMLTVFPNTAMIRGYVAGPGDTRPAAVRRAVAYIDDHVSLPITVTDIADAAGTTPRALRAAFHRHLDTTPTAHLRRARLHAARRDLEAAGGPVRLTVAEVAARWGYRNPARFTTDYAATHGAPPADRS